MFVKVFLVVVLVGPFQNALSDHLHPREYTSVQPNFEHSLYTKPFKDGRLEDLKVRVIDGRGRPVLIKEDGDIWRYFEVVRRVENDDDEFIVRSRDGIKWDKIKDAVFTLLIDDATLYPPVETVVIIKSEEVSIGQPRFESSHYTAELLDGFLESLKVRVIDGRGMPVLIKGDEDIGRYFEVIREVETGADVFIVRSKDGMKWDKIEDAVFLLLIDDATLYPPVETVVIIKSEEVSIGQPHFEFSLYTAEFVDGFLESLKVRVIDERGMSVLIKEDEDIRRYFEVIRDVETGDDVFIVKSKYDMKWDQMKDAVFTLLIDDETLGFPVETVVIIKSNLRQADFERPFYVGKFIDGMLDELFIRVINDFGIVPQIKEEEIRKYFEVIATTTTGDYVVRSKESIRWTADEDAMFTLKIDDSSLYSPVETAVIVKQVPRRPPVFDKSLYITEFVDGTLYDLSVKVIDGIGVGPTIVEIEINEYFEVIEDSTFPEDVYIVRTKAGQKWTSSQDAIFTLRIDDSALLSPVETVVIVKINFRHADFEQPFYVSEFIHGILNPLFIRVNNDFGVYPQIKEEEMKKYFEVIATTTAGDYVVRSKESIRWTEDEDAMFTLKIDDSSLYSPVETAVIVKQVPRRPPVFEKSIYTAEFVDGILDDLKVKVIDGFEVVPIIAETEINDYLEVIVDSTFPEEVYIVRTRAGMKWTSSQDAIFTLRIDDSALLSPVETVVIVKKEVFQINLPHFEKSAYMSDFEDGILREIRVKVLDSLGEVPTIVERDLRNYFEVTYSTLADDEFIIRSINGIKWDKNQDAIFTLQIADSSLNFPIETVVIVKWKEVGTFVHFILH